MTRIRRKPYEVDAVQVSHATRDELVEFTTGALHGPILDVPEASDAVGENPPFLAVQVRTATGEPVPARHGDWVVPDKVPGTFTVVSATDFAGDFGFEVVTAPKAEKAAEKPAETPAEAPAETAEPGKS